jgi:hypothetical protein
VAAAVMTPLLGVAVVIIAALGIRATRRGVASGDLLPPLTLALVVALIVFNKVGSPQFISWLAVPLILGLVTSATGRGGSFRTPAVLGLVIAALTQVIYPYLYLELLYVQPIMLIVLTARNLLLIVLLGWAVYAVATAVPQHDLDELPDVEADPSVWPLAVKSGGADT